jgi:hypothetical protein
MRSRFPATPLSLPQPCKAMIVRPSFERWLNERSIMDEWLSYAEAAERLNTTVEAVRLRALRGHWQKTIGNDRRPRIRLPEGWSNDVQTTVERRERKPRNEPTSR